MAKVRTTLTVDDEVLRAVKIKAARTGRGDSEIIEDALRRDLGLGVLGQLWANAELSEDEAMDLGLEAQSAVRQR
jgi:predicted transcriptional regulator